MRYQESGRAKDFVLDLLAIRVSKLLAIDPDEETAGANVQRNFKIFLQNFIKRNALKHALLSDMTRIMVNQHIEHYPSISTCTFMHVHVYIHCTCTMCICTCI